MKDGKTRHTFLKKLACGATLVSALGVAAPAHALYINLTSTGNATADTGFRAAANIWQGVFTDNVTVNITAGFAALGTNILAQAGSTYFSTDFSTMKSALTADSTSAEDAIMVAGLPGGSSYWTVPSSPRYSGGFLARR
ncbi:MAG TPA: hypothetical protein PLB25_17495, partial [Rhodoferax sp.]|nr:hypothetical protein [Rhodoferax sp.]